MAAVVDRDFFNAIGQMEEVARHDLSSCDIAWFVVDYDETSGDAVLTRGSTHLTTLEKAKEGLSGGRPVPQRVFEARIRQKLAKKYPEAAANFIDL